MGGAAAAFLAFSSSLWRCFCRLFSSDLDTCTQSRDELPTRMKEKSRWQRQGIKQQTYLLSGDLVELEVLQLLSRRSGSLVAWFSGHDVVEFVVYQLIAGRFQERDGDAFSVLYERGVTQEILSMVTRLNRGCNNRGAYLIEAARARWDQPTPQSVLQGSEAPANMAAQQCQHSSSGTIKSQRCLSRLLGYLLSHLN